jgi:DNA-binding beta-propeller fold protein YncE
MASARHFSRRSVITLAAAAGLVATVVTAGNSTAQTAPGAKAAQPARYLFAPNFSNNVVSVFDLRTNKLIKYIDVQAQGPCCAHPSPDGKTVYIVEGFSPYVTTLDVATMSVRRQTKIGGPIGDVGSELQNDGKMFWANNLPFGDAFGIETATGKVVKTYKGIAPKLAVSRDGKVLYTAGDNYLTAWSTATGKMLSRAPSNESLAVMVPRTGSQVYVQGSNVEVFDASNPARVRKIKTIAVGSPSWNGRLSPDDSQLWMPGQDNGKVVVVDLVRGRVAKVINIGQYGGGLVLSENGRAYISVSPRRFAPIQHSALLTAYLGVVPGAALPVPSTTRRAFDPPGEIYVYDAKTFQRLATPPMKLPGISFNLGVVENPPSLRLRSGATQ